MAELTINIEDITAALRHGLDGFKPALLQEQVGTVTEVGDGIARVGGLPGCAVNELLEFEDGTQGLALNLDEDSIGAVILGNVGHIQQGQSARFRPRLVRSAWTSRLSPATAWQIRQRRAKHGVGRHRLRRAG